MVVVPTVLLLSSAVWAVDPSGTGEVFLGVRHLGRGPWAEVATPVQAGVVLAWTGSGSWWEPVLGFAQAQGSGTRDEVWVPTVGSSLFGIVGPTGTATTRVDVACSEWDLGVRTRFRLLGWEATAGAGPALVRVSVRRTVGITLGRLLNPDPAAPRDSREEATVFGAWSALAIAYPLGTGSLGLEGRWTFAQGELLDEPADLGGLQIGAVVRLAW